MNAGEFERAKANDLNELHRLEQQCFDAEAFSRRQLRYLINRAKGEFWISRENGQISSFLILLKKKNSRGMRLYSLAVSPTFRRRGLAEKALAKAELSAQQSGLSYLYLEVSENNQAAIQLYLRFGFEVFGERRAYYADGSKALLMRKFV